MKGIILSYTNSMNLLFRYLTILGILVGSPLALRADPSYRTPFSNALESRLQTHAYVRENPGMGRLSFMRFYFPTNEVKEEPEFFEKLFSITDTACHVRATAFYLFNMYVSTAAYRVDMPGKLTLGYVGVLDGFAKCQDPFDWNEAEDFYQQHQQDVQHWLQLFFHKAGLPAYTPQNKQNATREKAFARLLKTADKHGKMAGYRWTGKSYLKGNPRVQEEALLRVRLEQALFSGRDKVVTFTQGAATLEDFDVHTARKRNRQERTYRYVNDECNYCSYMFGKQFCQEVAEQRRNWGYLRLYKITAYPVKSEFLIPAIGNRFVQADKRIAPPWRYHTATLVVMDSGKHYTPFVVDSFLAGDNAQTLDKWAQHFAGNETFFEIVPFERSAEVEESIKTPSGRRGENVIVDGAEYKPHPVLN